ncbi:GMC oxidoreductase [Paractinoplanes rishiriensis]|uniref:Glucose-methanol-choline oxidoreductase C-terminal domain-containing protein n=1 Tax=Paractinoplanes rishiriensis TaxID=1050105 RepID=A0A919K6P7_9ACTN|nr:GMC oxidoreductase [Actinoplanes rishiriensis]GIE99777.1 hypothetical protein Ari01nite_72420 [Actinoplanes rishiriensis]
MAPEFEPDQALLSTMADVAGRRFDHVIVGGGCVGTVLAASLLDRDPHARVLILEQGPWLLGEHVQDLAPQTQALMDTAIATPWRTAGDLFLAAQIPHLGGRALFWSGWTPQPRPDQLRAWPAPVVRELGSYWAEAREVLGVHTAAYGPLHDMVRARIRRALPGCPGLETPASPEQLDALLASAMRPRTAGRSRFSPVPVLVGLLRAHPDRFAVVAECPVEGFRLAGTEAGAEAVAVRTAHGDLPLDGARLLLANGTVESTRLVLDALPAERRPLAGRNLNGHVGSWFACRVPRSAFPGLPEGHVLGAYYLDGGIPERQFHLQLIASATTDAARDHDRIYRSVPELSGADIMAQLAADEHVVFLVRGLGEISTDGPAESPVAVRLGADGTTEVDLRLDPADRRMWDALDACQDALLAGLFDGEQLEYWSSEEQRWTAGPPAARRQPFLMHEAGTLWMGESPDDSVTDLHGRPHGVTNVHVATAAAFPTEGSWNPTLTMVAMAVRLAAHLAAEATCPPARPLVTAAR